MAKVNNKKKQLSMLVVFTIMALLVIVGVMSTLVVQKGINHFKQQGVNEYKINSCHKYTNDDKTQSWVECEVTRYDKV